MSNSLAPMDTSSFSTSPQTFPDAERLETGGSTCDSYRVRRYGKQHFLKRLKPELRTAPRYVAALQKEFETGYQLEHPNLVRYVEHGDDYIPMDYVDGETLDQFCQTHSDYFRHRKNSDAFLRQLLSALQYLHEHQVLHLDLKPSNILITHIGHEVRLVDFGFCYTDTYPDTTGRTDKYAAPEQLDGTNDVDDRTDIYAVGKILTTLPCARTYNKIIRRCTKTDKSKRYLSIEELQKALNRPTHKWVWAVVVLAAAIATLAYIHRPSSYETATERPHNRKTEQPYNPITEQPHNRTTEQPHNPITVQPYNRITEQPHNPTTEDTLRLRAELQALARPVFERTLATYRDSSYEAVGFLRFSELTSAFRKEVMALYRPLWEKYRKEETIPEHTFYTECSETILYFTGNLYFDMQRNDHNPEYTNKVYHYYDSRQP